MGGSCAATKVGINDNATASKPPRATQQDIATLLDPDRIPTPEGRALEIPREAAIWKQRVWKE